MYKNRYILFSIFFLSVLVFSCKTDPFGEKVDSPKTIEIITKSDELTKVFADGNSTFKIVVGIDKNASNKYRNVTFTCSNGELVGAKNGIREVLADEEGSASVEWKVPDSAGKSFIFASIGEGEGVTKYKKEILIDVKEINKNLTFTPNITDLKNIQADDKQTIIFTGKITANLPTKYRTLIFECTDGKFVGVGGDTKREVEVDEKGEASITWKVGNQAGKKYVSASIKNILNAKNEKEIELVSPKPKFKMSVIDFDKIYADGISLLKIQIDSAVNISNNKIKIIKNLGEFVDGAGSPIKDGELTLASGKAIVFIKMGQIVENYFIKTQTESGDFFLNQSFIPKRAFGEEIFINSESKTDEIGITVSLSRSLGKVSEGTPVTFESYQTINGVKKIVGIFQNLKNAKTNADESVSVTLKNDDNIDKKLSIFIKVSSSKNESGNDFISKTIEAKMK